MNIVVLVLMGLAARAVLRLVTGHLVPRLRAGIEGALRNDWAWLGTWVVIAATVGTAVAMAHARGHLA